jgi:4-amino-4-deoxy-L-arabinose transferase-like glycosyltransferase
MRPALDITARSIVPKRASALLPWAATPSRAFILGLTGLLLVFLALGSQYARQLPLWQAPDEPAHYNYVRQLAEQGQPPKLEAGDWNQAYLDELTSRQFPPELSVRSLGYEDHQPPLYYYLLLPTYWVSAGAWLPLRLTSLLLGAALLLLTGLAAAQVFPDSWQLALAATGFSAFLPQHVAMLAVLNNDVLAELWVAAGLLWLLWHLRFGHSPTLRAWLLLGVILGAAFLTKTTAYSVAALALVYWLWLLRRHGWHQVGWQGLACMSLASALGGVWWLRNLAVYGGSDFLGLQQHNRVVIGQLRTADFIAKVGWGDYLTLFARTTFQSFWGQFGWLGVPLPTRYYGLLLLFSVLLLVGCGLAGRFAKSSTGLPALWYVLLAQLVLAVGLYVYYNVEFVQFQARYTFTALPGLGCLAALGVSGWVGLGQRLLPKWRWFWQQLPLALPLGLAIFSAWVLWRVVMPAW